MSIFRTLISIMVVSGFALSAQALRATKGQVILDKLEEYDRCQTMDYAGDFCHDALVRWVDSHPADAFKAGKMTRLKMNAHNALPFFAKALDRKELACADEDVKMAVISGLGLPTDAKESIKTAKKIGLEVCAKEMQDEITSATRRDEGMMKNVCKDLVAKNLLKGVAAKRCQALTE